MRWWYSPLHVKTWELSVPQGAYARYEKDVASVAHVIGRRGAVPDRIVEGEEVVVPTFELAVNPQIRLSEIKARRLTVKATLNLAICWKILKAFMTTTDKNVNVKNNERLDNQQERLKSLWDF